MLAKCLAWADRDGLFESSGARSWSAAVLAHTEPLRIIVHQLASGDLELVDFGIWSSIRYTTMSHP